MNRKQEIIDAVLEIFSEKGFTNDFTMSKLAQKLDIGKSTIYEYFNNKDEIIEAAIYQYFESRLQKVNVVADINDLPFEEAFKTQMTILLNVAQESRSILEALAPGFVQKLPESMRGDMKKRVEETRNRLQVRFVSFFEKGVSEGVITCGFNPTLGLMVTSLVVGSIMVFSDTRVDTDVTTFVDELYNNVMKILH